MTVEIIKEEEIIIRNYRTSDYQATLKILKELQSKYDKTNNVNSRT